MTGAVRTLSLALALVCAAGTIAWAQDSGTVLTPKQRERERKGVAAFAASRFQDALDIYAELYADFHDPIYLRNIGRCHYKLHHPDEAISSFEEYLAQYKRLTPAERAQIDGWIADMRQLQQPAPTVTTPAPDLPPPLPIPGPAAARPVAPPRPAPVTTAQVAPALAAPAPIPRAPAPPALQLRQPAPPSEDTNAGIRHAGVGAIVVGAALAVTGAVFAATSWSKYDSAKNGACLATNEGCGKAADAIEQRATLSKVFFAGGALLGVTGAALIIFFPASHSSRTTMAGAAWTF